MDRETGISQGRKRDNKDVTSMSSEAQKKSLKLVVKQMFTCHKKEKGVGYMQ